MLSLLSLRIPAPHGRHLSPAAARAIGLVAWFALLLPALEFQAGRDAALRAVLSTGALPDDGPVAEAMVVLWIIVGTMTATLPLTWARALTMPRRGWSQATEHALVTAPLLTACVSLVVPYGAAVAVVLVALVIALPRRRAAYRPANIVALGVAASVGISAARGLLLVGLLMSAAYCVVSLSCAGLDVARRPVTGRRRRWSSRRPSTTDARLPAGEQTTPSGELESARAETQFRRAARSWRARLAIAAPETVVERDPRFNAMLRIHSRSGSRARSSVERILRECTRRWERIGCEPGDNGVTILSYGVRVGRTARGRLLDALQGSALAHGVELR